MTHVSSYEVLFGWVPPHKLPTYMLNFSNIHHNFPITLELIGSGQVRPAINMTARLVLTYCKPITYFALKITLLSCSTYSSTLNVFSLKTSYPIETMCSLSIWHDITNNYLFFTPAPCPHTCTCTCLTHRPLNTYHSQLMWSLVLFAHITCASNVSMQLITAPPSSLAYMCFHQPPTTLLTHLFSPFTAVTTTHW